MQVKIFQTNDRSKIAELENKCNDYIMDRECVNVSHYEFLDKEYDYYSFSIVVLLK